MAERGGELRPSSGRGRPVPRALAWVAVASVFALMLLGNIVSATGSGLACPDWPLCHGRLIPPLAADVLIEYGHRLAAAVTSIVLVVTIVASFRGTTAPGVRRLGFVLLGLLAVQIALGGITVLFKLPHLISTAHLVNALLILAGLLALCAAGGAAEGRPGAASATGRAKIRRLAIVGLAVLLAQLTRGGYVRHSGAGLACPDFPLCSGDVFPDHWLAAVHWTHRWLGAALLGLFTHLALAARGSAAARPAGIALALAVAQVTLGILTVLLQLRPSIRATHAAGGYALWATLVWTALRAGVWRPGDATASRMARPARA